MEERLTDPGFQYASVIVTQNTQRDTMNNFYAPRFAAEHARSISTFYARDTNVHLSSSKNNPSSKLHPRAQKRAHVNGSTLVKRWPNFLLVILTVVRVCYPSVLACL
jgi:hypothetical protein